MTIADFPRRLTQYIRSNRAGMIRALIIAAVALAAFLLIRAGVERLQKARYERRAEALEAQVRAADTKAKAAEDRAAAMQIAIEAKYAELRNLELRAASAESALRETRRAVAPLKEAYEEARDNPVIPADTTCADACRELAGLGHSCD